MVRVSPPVEPQGAGDCFARAARLIWRDARGTLVLVHGHPIGTGAENLGQRFWHAWVEVTEEVTIPAGTNGANPDHGPFTLTLTTCLDRTGDEPVAIPRDLYYRLGRIEADECRRYTRGEALTALQHWGHWGPWDDEHPPV